MKLLRATDTTYEFEADRKVLVYDRVTAVLSIARRFDGIPAEVLDRARLIGQAVHRAIWLLEGGGDASGLDWSTVHPDVAPYIRGYLEAKRVLRFRIIGKEGLVWSHVHRLAGRYDLVAVGLDPGRTIVDMKTGEPHWSHRLQLAAYEALYRESAGWKGRLGRRLVYLTGTGRFSVDACEGSTVMSDFREFCALHQAYLVLRAHGGA